MMDFFLKQINWDQPASVVHNFIRGMDSAPGAVAVLNNEKVKLFGSQRWMKSKPDGDTVDIRGLVNKGIVHPEGLLLTCKDGSLVNAVKFSVKNGVFWDVMPCSSCKNRCFGGT
jgi:formyltetrahydrofolate dehydrogenase